MERTKRKTAGKRMGDLVGKALEQDDAFWGHDTWAEDADSGNDSFHESDEDSAQKKDEFDSDFNDSESDNEEEEVEAGLEAERELKRSERSNQQKSKVYKDIASAGRAMMPKRGKGKGTSRRVVGDGINAGIVLNFPPPTASLDSSSLPTVGQAHTATGSASLPAGHLVSTAAPKKPASKSKEKISLASTRERRSQQMLKRLRDDRSTARGEKHKKIPRPAATKKAKRRQYGQEELLLEAIHDTEPENRRWLLARKRVQDLVDQDKDSMSGRDRAKGKIVEKYHSRRGCLNTLTFPEMDFVPDILTRSSPAKSATTTRLAKAPDDDSNTCVITGKRAKYRDPQTKHGYHDVAAFKELRRREQAGEPLDQRPKKEISSPKLPPTSTNGSTTEPVVSDTTATAASALTTNSKLKLPSKQQNQQPQPCVAVQKAVPSSATPKPAPKKVSSSSKTKKTASTTKQAGNKAATAPPSKTSAAKRQTSTSSTASSGNKSSSRKNSTNPVGSSSEGKQTPVATKPVLSISNSRLETSPVSPTRQSGRKWKPSAKLLENIIHSGEQKKGGATLGVHLKPKLAPPPLNASAVPVPAAVGDGTINDGASANTKTAQPPQTVNNASSNVPSTPAATETAQNQNSSKKKAPAKLRSKKECKTAPKKAGKTTAKPKSLASQGKKGTKSTSSGAEKKLSTAKSRISSGKKTATPKTPNGTPKTTPKTAPRGKKAVSSSNPVKPSNRPDDHKVKGVESKSAVQDESGTEKIYTIPADEATGEGPRFVTQSELVMAAINNYNKSKEEHLITNHQKTDDDDGKNAKTKK